MGPGNCQNKDADVAASERHRTPEDAKPCLKRNRQITFCQENGCFTPHQKVSCFASHVNYLGTLTFSLH